ncbi:hypothetical protein VTL71DRAFT_2551 [Oculimacula yallundae]|uniref:GATA-type domain-containing protein n=1 Tax=Oculimacula yallundae TaxID=86028 RepID=A0ABR4C961_9HELO
MSDHLSSTHPFGEMGDRHPSPQHRAEEAFPLRTSLPARERSKEELELAQQLLGHSQAQRDTSGDSPSPRYDSQRPPSTSPSIDRMRQVTPGSVSEEQGQREPSYAPSSLSQHDAAPSGQVCSNCGTSRTPLWRRSPQGATICNACGLYLKARNSSRPTNLKRPPSIVQSGQHTPEQRRLSPSGIGSAGQVSTASTYVAADHASLGSCPGGGKCNGTGGAEGCSGCPAFNNRVSKSAHMSGSQGSPAPSQPSNDQPTDAPSPIDVTSLTIQHPNTTVVVACQNCGTTITPLWRRDESGHTICNACGMSLLQTTRCPPPCNDEEIGHQKTKACSSRDSRHAGIGLASTTMGSPEPEYPSPSHETARGTINPDGSVNLGLRLRDDQARSFLPEPTTSSRGQSGPSSDLTAYSSSSHTHTHDRADSLNNENRLPPMTSYPPPVHQRPSVSPHSFLSPSRKRSFSTTEMEQLPPISDTANPNSTQPKRLSSIKSILNPGYTESEPDVRSGRRSPAQYRGSQSPNMGYASSPGTAGTSREREPQSEGDRSRTERREALRLEAESMREALKAKERELEELGMGE